MTMTTSTISDRNDQGEIIRKRSTGSGDHGQPQPLPKPQRTPERTPETKRERSLQLAEKAELGAHSCKLQDVTLDKASVPVQVVVWVASRSQQYHWHQVVYDCASDTASCDCEAASYGLPCHHAGCGVLYGRETVNAYAEATREYFAVVRAESNAAAIAPSL